ncbi:Tetratricopeptide repeat (TPR) superfamily protein [Trifolium repens]|nr:Tetratricopeptide repeat (TPR) superfamily protein [Trifolium repens]
MRQGIGAGALHECENLKKKGAFDEEGLHVYAFLLRKHGENGLTLFVARSLAATLLLKKYLRWLPSVSSLD